MPAKNFLMFSIDDMRTVNSWGHFTPLISTPNMDRLAAMGTTFERAITQVPLCNPARTSVMTGLQPSRTGVLDNDIPWFERVDPADTLPAVLKASGAYVAMYGKHFHTHTMDPNVRAVMFDEFLGPGGDGLEENVIQDNVWHESPFFSGRYVGNLIDDRTAAAAIDFLQNQAGDLTEPFFLGVGIQKPHPKWWVPSEFFDRYDPAAIRAALRQSLMDGTIIPGDGEYFDVPPMSEPSLEHPQIAGSIDQWADYIHAYLASISFADAKIGEVLDALEADPDLAADTSILLWSDHGYHLGDKDRWGKFDHWREATQVPFILVDPEAQGGQTARQIVSLVDIFPTVLDLMEIDAPSRLRLSGDSLLPIVRDFDFPWFDSDTGRGVALTTIYGSFSIRAHVPGRGDFRYTRYPDGTEELYDITRDPGEHVNRVNYDTGVGLTPAYDAIAELMGGLMDDELARSGVLISDGSGSVTGTAANELLVSTNGPGANVLVGRGGDDTYVLYRPATITETASGGVDMVVIRNEAMGATWRLPDNIEIVHVIGDFTGNSGANLIFGTEEDNVLRGAGGDDRLTGFGGEDTLAGGDGADILRGSAGEDVLVGGQGADMLDGGPSGDIFDFNAASTSSPSAPDTILVFDGQGLPDGDTIDLSTIDANATVPGNQTFQFGGAAIGRVRLLNVNGNTEVHANTDADPASELRILIRDGSRPPGAYTAGDFEL